MACYSFNLEIISRGSGNSIVGSAAYISGKRLVDEYYGRTYDYSHRSDVVSNGIIMPSSAPDRLYDLQTLLNDLDEAERRKDSQLARSLKLALPNELSPEEWLNIVKIFCDSNFVSKGCCVIYAIHEGHYDPAKKAAEIIPVFERKNNPHAHLIVPFRTIDASGFQHTKPENRFMARNKDLVSLRESWANVQNQAFERLGLDARVTHKSLKDQGINREPSIHVGAVAMEMEKRGDPSKRGNWYLQTLAKSLPAKSAQQIERTLAQRKRKRASSKELARSPKMPKAHTHEREKDCAIRDCNRHCLELELEREL